MMDDLISREAAIDAVNKAYDRETLLTLFMRSTAVRAIRNMPSAQPEYRWIPCSERTPEDKKAVYWGCNDSGDQFECRWTNVSPISGRETDWHWNIFDVPQYSKVVAWMHLPNPYKEEANDPEG